MSRPECLNFKQAGKTTHKLDRRQRRGGERQREALLLSSPLVVTGSQCCIAIRESHEKIKSD